MVDVVGGEQKALDILYTRQSKIIIIIIIYCLQQRHSPARNIQMGACVDVYLPWSACARCEITTMELFWSGFCCGKIKY